MPRKPKSDQPSPAVQRAARIQAIADAYTGDTIPDLLFQKAVELENVKRAMLTELAANRRSMRDLAAQGILSQEDVDSVYPPKAASEEAPEEAAA